MIQIITQVCKILFPYRYVFFIICIFYTCYAYTCTFPYVWDDLVMVQDNLFLTESTWVHLFTHSAFGETFSVSKFYRPIQLFSYWLDIKLFGKDPFYFHLMSTVYGCMVAVLGYFILKRLQFSSFLAFILALIFCMHPIHIEAITYIAGRGDILYMFFCLSSFFLFIRNKLSFSIMAGVILLIVLALITKENSVSFALVLCMYAWFFGTFRHKVLSGTLLFVSGGYALFRLLTPASTEVLSWIGHSSLYERICTLPYLVCEYIKLIFFPAPLHMEYHTVITSLANGYLLLAVCFLVLFIVPIRFVRRKFYYAFGIGWFFICLIPVSQIVKPLAATVREHWASLALFGIVLALGTILEMVKDQHKRVVHLGLLCIVMCLCFTTMYRNHFWSNSQLLYENDLKYEPRSFVMLNNLGGVYYEQKKYSLAKAYFLKAVYNSPGYAYDVALNNVGVVYQYEGDLDIAEYYYRQSIVKGHYELAYQNLLVLLRAQGRSSEYDQVVELYDRYKNK